MTMKKLKKIISIAIIYSLFCGEFTFASAADKLSPELMLKDFVFQNNFYKTFQEFFPAAYDLSQNHSLALIERAEIILDNYQMGMEAAYSRIFNPLKKELQISARKQNQVEIVSLWLNSPDPRKRERRAEILRHSVFELLGPKHSGVFLKISSQAKIDKTTREFIANLLSSCGTHSFLVFHLLQAENVVVIDNDRINHIFAAIENSVSGKNYYQALDDNQGMKMVAEDLGISPEGLSAVDEPRLAAKGYRVHRGLQARMFIFGYIFNNVGAGYYAAYLKTGNEEYLALARHFLIKSYAVAPGYDVPRRNLAKLLETGVSLKPGDKLELNIEKNIDIVSAMFSKYFPEYEKNSEDRDFLTGKGIFLPTDKEDVIAAAKFLELNGKSRVIDLGSGLGHIGFYAAAFGAKVKMVEYDAGLSVRAGQARTILKNQGMDISNVDIRKGDFFSEDLGGYDVIFYAFSGTYWPDQKKLLDKIFREMAPKAKLVVFRIPENFEGFDYQDHFRKFHEIKADLADGVRIFTLPQAAGKGLTAENRAGLLNPRISLIEQAI